MSVEDDVRTIMINDATLMAILAGGVYTRGSVGRDGLTSEATPDIFNADGDLLPCALIRARDLVGDDQVTDFDTKALSAAQAVEIYFYEENNYANIDQAMARTRFLLLGEIVADSFEMEWTLELPRERDEAALAGASLARQDWFLNLII